MNSAESFSATYAEARAKFRAAAEEAGGELDTIANPNKGPDGGDLSADTAWFGPRSAERVLVMVSGTHGGEGFCGSGAQVDWLRRGEAANLPPGLAVLMIHAINPFGFAWLRRVTEENVDLNRNWIDFAQPVPENPGYDELADAAVPDQWTEETQRATARVLRTYAETHGAMALQQALSGGQYKHAGGVFYGGAGPTWARRTQEAIYREALAQAGRIAIIDYHTGLGPWGYAEPIMSDRAGTPAYDRGLAWWGCNITCPSDGSSTSAETAGDNLTAAPQVLAPAEVTGMALEYGTKSLAEVFLALRADAWLHAHGDPLSPEGQAIKAQIRDAFYGDADDWKGMVVGQSLTAVRQAIAGLMRS
ncbi:MAG TPA: M14 family metallopeptidase [Caulobacteraceae bacterium]|nr:M14 family metallopeptidase [Caulobacteraceae bacterium]